MQQFLHCIHLVYFFITHKIFSRSTGPPTERETRPVLMDIPLIKSRQQQYLNRGLELERKSFMTILKSYRNIFQRELGGHAFTSSSQDILTFTVSRFSFTGCTMFENEMGGETFVFQVLQNVATRLWTWQGAKLTLWCFCW